MDRCRTPDHSQCGSHEFHEKLKSTQVCFFVERNYKGPKCMKLARRLAQQLQEQFQKAYFQVSRKGETSWECCKGWGKVVTPFQEVCEENPTLRQEEARTLDFQSFSIPSLDKIMISGTFEELLRMSATCPVLSLLLPNSNQQI